MGTGSPCTYGIFCTLAVGISVYLHHIWSGSFPAIRGCVVEETVQALQMASEARHDTSSPVGRNCPSVHGECALDGARRATRG